MPEISTEKPTNILLIFSDQHRYDAMGCAGNPDIQTPNLDWLASNGTNYKNVWCQSPFCQPSRTSFITGLYPHQTGFRELASLSNPPTLMKKLKKAGYETATFGKMHYAEINSLKKMTDKQQFNTAGFDDYFKGFGWDHLVQEFDKYHHVHDDLSTPYLDHLAENGLKRAYQNQIKDHMRGTPNHWKASVSKVSKEHDLTSFLTNQALAWLKKRKNPNKPFFVKLAYVQPHPPMIADEKWSQFYADKDIQRPSFNRIKSNIPVWQEYISSLENHAQIKHMKKSHHIAAIKKYYAMISLIDEEVGRVIDLLKQTNQLDNTTIIYTCDHGEMMGEHRLWGKMNFFRGSVQVPLIIYNHSQHTGEVNSDLIELIDLHHFIGLKSVSDPKSKLTLSKQRQFCFSSYGKFASIRNTSQKLTLHVPSNSICEFTAIKDEGKEQGARDLKSSQAESLKNELVNHLNKMM